MDGQSITRYFPEKVRTEIADFHPDWEAVEEIRIRSGKPLMIYMNNEEYVLTYCPSQMDIQNILNNLTGHSLYAYQDEIKNGYFTLEGGHRIGVIGRAVMEEGQIKTQKYISFLNIRLAHEKKNCANGIVERLVRNNELQHTLIVSPPGCGKTTLLRDMVRLVSDGFYYINEKGARDYFHGVTVGVVDERSEIGGCVCGIPTKDLGTRTDIIDGVSKHVGIFLLLRSMAPKVIAVDEIGNEEDFYAVKQAVNSGCTVFATVHGASVGEISKKKVIGTFLKEGIFERYIVLSSRKGRGTVEEIGWFGDWK